MTMAAMFDELAAAFKAASDPVDPDLSPAVQRILESADARCACCAHGKRGLRVITGALAKEIPLTLPPVRPRRTLA